MNMLQMQHTSTKHAKSIMDSHGKKALKEFFHMHFEFVKIYLRNFSIVLNFVATNFKLAEKIIQEKFKIFK